MNKKKILIVEDEKDIRTMLATDVKAAGYEIFEAEDGFLALKVAEEVKPDLIITDVLMPKMNGSELIKRLRATDWGKKIPIIVLTVRVLMRDYFDIVGVSEFVDKPFTSDEILKKIEKILGKQDSTKIIVEKPSERMLSEHSVGQEKPHSDAPTKEKYCDTCHRTIPFSSTVCPRCGSTKIRIK